MPVDELTTYAQNTWCVGCGNFGILNAVKAAFRELGKRGIGTERLFLTAGIGCHGKIFDYLRISGFNALHGRSMATAQGIKLANPNLKVVCFAGDGDAYGEGLEHMVFAAKRNADITVIVHDNAVYGLTTGQYTPTSIKGFKGRSTPRGTVEEPLNPLALLTEAGATFVARGYSGKIDHLKDTIVAAVEHEGFSCIDVLQPCVTYHNTYKHYNEIITVLETVKRSYGEAMAICKREDSLPVGIIYQTDRITFHKALLGDASPIADRVSRDKRLSMVNTVLAKR
jgi:2-oxoglutarate ferredoxin oxidoreductase subunit beta